MHAGITVRLTLAGLALGFLASPASARAEDKPEEAKARKLKPEDLPERYRKWLEEEVVWIISDYERDAFLTLTDDRGREMFRDAFWAVRDPTPGTSRNEYREEHYKRIKEANELFGRSKSKPGWRTERGRIYIQLGPPRYRTQYPYERRLYPMEDWLYQGDPGMGLPPFFHIVFYQPYGIPDWELYDPVADGPEKLIGGESVDRAQALTYLGQLNPELQTLSLSLIPSEHPDFTVGLAEMGSMRLVSRLKGLEERQPYDKSYVEQVLSGRPHVEVEYSFRHLAMRGHFHGAFGPGGSVLHYAVEIPPESLTLQRYGDRISGAIEIVGRIFTARDTQPVHQIEEKVEFELTPGQFEGIKASPFAFTSLVPLLPGAYKISLIVRNIGSKEFGTIDGSFDIPGFREDRLTVGPVLVAALARPSRGKPGDPFTFGDLNVYPSSGGAVRMSETATIVTQIAYPRGVLRSSSMEVSYALHPEDQPGQVVAHGSTTVRVNPAERGVVSVNFEIPLTDVGAGKYGAAVTASVPGAPQATRSTGLQMLRHLTISAPWVYVSDRLPDPRATALMLADQQLKRGNEKEAIARLESIAGAAGETPRSTLEVRMQLAELRLGRHEYDQAREIIEPVALTLEAPSHALLLLGLARSGAGDHEGAIHALQKALERSPTSTELLNVLGEEWLRAGRQDNAAASFRRSLEIDQEQPRIREALNHLAPPTPTEQK